LNDKLITSFLFIIDPIIKLIKRQWKPLWNSHPQITTSLACTSQSTRQTIYSSEEWIQNR